nr:PREDICTED: F-BAR and double SH3 domains protein 1 isoform X2 [Lepisosteus oculatus]
MQASLPVSPCSPEGCPVRRVRCRCDPKFQAQEGLGGTSRPVLSRAPTGIAPPSGLPCSCGVVLRSFSKQRAAIEREYGQALHRLGTQYLKRDCPRGKGEVPDTRSALAVWRSLVEATVQSGLSRLTAAETYRSLTAEALKNLRTAKEQRMKRGLEQLQRVQGELVEAARELNKAKKRYSQLEHIAEVAREKAADAQAKSKKNDHGILRFRTSMQKLSVKLSARLSECDQRLTEARNEYLLALAAINAHHEHYRCSALPGLMQDMDGDLYSQLREQFALLCGTEIDTCQSTQIAFCRIQDTSRQVSRECDLQLFLQESPAFTRASVFHFQAAANDKVSTVTQRSDAHEGESFLDKEARKWATKMAKDYKIIAHGERALQALETRGRLGPVDDRPGVERRAEEVKESVRKAQVSRVKAEARLALLRSCQVDVDSWVSGAMSQADEELERERRLSEARLSNGELSPLGDEFEFTDFEEFDENGDTFTESSLDPCPRGYPLPCRVLYSYQACQADELSITEGEELEVIEDGDMEDWLKARNAAGQQGYVPERYLQFLKPSAGGAALQTVPGSPQPDGGSTASGSSAGIQGREHSTPNARRARALYEYRGQSAEELSFPEGALIRLLRCGDGEVDDGFWEGELDGRVGVFPSLVVELLGEGDEEEDEEEGLSSPTPPPFSPPVPVLGASPVPQCSSPGPGTWSAHSMPPRGPEERLQAVPQDVLRPPDRGAESGSSAHSSPEVSARRIRPMRAPPLPPAHRRSPAP